MLFNSHFGKFIALTLVFQCITVCSSLPSNYTHEARLIISIDQDTKGELQFGLYGGDSPQAVTNFLAQCDARNPHRNMTALKALNLSWVEDRFSFEKKEIYQIIENEFLQFGDYFTDQHVGKGNFSYFGDTYYSQINQYHTQFGALAQERSQDSGHVGSEYTVFFKRASFDGRRSLWHVFGTLIEGNEFLRHIFYTGGQNNGVPRRQIFIDSCQITKIHQLQLNKNQAENGNS